MDWALALTLPNAERRFSADLTRREFPHHVFWLERRLVRRGRVITVLRPAFNRYVFVPFDRAWRILREFWRVATLVTMGGNLARIPAAHVKALVSRCRPGCIIPVEYVPRWHQGDRVHIAGYGPMSGQRAVYDHSLNDDRSCLLINWMGQMARISVNDADIESELASRKRGRRRPQRRY